MKLDIVISFLTKTQEREKMVNFSQSYFQGKQTILTKKDNNITTKDYDEYDIILKDVSSNRADMVH